MDLLEGKEECEAGAGWEVFGKGKAAELAAEKEILEGPERKPAQKGQSPGAVATKADSSPNRIPRGPGRSALGQARPGSADAPDTNPGMGGKARGCR